MSKIIIPARFHVCPNCGCHGHLVFGDNSKGEDVDSEAAALLQVDQAKKDGKIHEVEVPLLKEQIRDANLSPDPTNSLPSGLLGVMIASALSNPSPVETGDRAQARQAHKN